MGKLSEKQRETFGRIIAVSILLHVVLAGLIFVKLPQQLPTPEDNAVKVELVPPPEEKPPEPPPPPKQEEAKKPDPPKPPPKPPEPQKKQSIPSLKPAVEFGQKDSGPKISTDGDATEDQAKSTEDKPADPPPTETAAEPAKPEPPVPAPKPVEPQLLATNNPADMKVDLNDRPPETPPAAEKPTQDTAKPQDKQANVSGKPSTGRKLTQARKIFSRSKTSDPIARLAMGMVSRNERFDRLCGTELVAQLQHGSPAYNPVLFPRVVRPQGNVFDLPNGSFRDAQGWRELSFKCEVDSEAMKVVSFAFSVGKPIPKSEWQSRGFPEY
ncbi:DUF930 domain-containing protein [Rhizobium sp. RAF56]|uniref:DUF930 domain-containing protein n=1 Tax=Rhizobium sp. RAF56 TaxID=3233062 RepID=UPI003F9A3D83